MKPGVRPAFASQTVPPSAEEEQRRRQQAQERKQKEEEANDAVRSLMLSTPQACLASLPREARRKDSPERRRAERARGASLAPRERRLGSSLISLVRSHWSQAQELLLMEEHSKEATKPSRPSKKKKKVAAAAPSKANAPEASRMDADLDVVAQDEASKSDSSMGSARQVSHSGGWRWLRRVGGCSGEHVHCTPPRRGSAPGRARELAAC